MLDCANERHFFLQVVDGSTATVLSETYCGVSTFEEIAGVLSVPIEDLSPLKIPFITSRDAKRISRKFRLAVRAPRGSEFQLESWSPADGLSYRVHSGR